MFGVNYSGLRKRESYDEIVDYLQNRQEVINYPNRWAKRIREHPYLTQLDGDGMLEMEDQQKREWKEHEKEQRVREVAQNSTQTVSTTRVAMSGSTSKVTSMTHVPDSDMNADIDMSHSEASKRLNEAAEREAKKRASVQQTVARHLGTDPGEIPYIRSAASAARSRSPRSKDFKTMKPGMTPEIDMDIQTNLKRGTIEGSSSSKRQNTNETKVPVRARDVPATSLESFTVGGSNEKKRRARSSDEVQMTGLNANNSTDMSFWEQQSANELRSQITMRKGKRGDWAVKTKVQLLELIRQMISEGTWVTNDTGVGSSSNEKKRRSTSVVTGLTQDKAKELKHWEKQNVSNIKSEINKRTGKSNDWAGKTKDQLLGIIKKMLLEDKW